MPQYDTCCQDPAQTIDKQDVAELIVAPRPPRLDKIKSVFPMFLLHRKTPTFGDLAAEDAAVLIPPLPPVPWKPREPEMAVWV